MDIQAEFTEKFYNLWNAPIAQSKKNFNEFINEIDNKITQEDVRCELIANFEPRNKLEISFKIDLLTRYRMYDKIMEILKTDTNSLYVSNILKNWTFFKETFKDITPNELVNDILPNLSYSTRMKVLNRISKNLFDEKLADEYFAAVEDKYEIVSASVLLGSCSIPFVKEKIEKYDLILSLKQVEAILRKDATFLDYYLDRTQSSSKVKMCDTEKLMKIIFKRDQELFWKLNEKYEIVANCGKRSTRKIIKEHQNLLIDKRDEYPVKLNSRVMFQEWKRKPEIFKSFIKNNSPEDMDWYFLKGSNASILAEYDRYISEDRQYNFLNYAFKERFGCNLHDKPELFTENLLLLMPVNLRDNILETKLKNNKNLLYLRRPEISFPLILDKIKHTSDIYKRERCVLMLFKSCFYHNDAEYLLKTLQYVETRHKNDTKVLKKFFRDLSHWKNIETLSTEHWTHIDGIRKLLINQNQPTNEKYFLVKRIGNLLNNHLDIDKQMRIFLEIYKNETYLPEIFIEIPQYRKHCILELKKYIDESDKSEDASNLFILAYLTLVHHYNSTNPDDKIPFSHFIPLIKSLPIEYLPDLQSFIEHYIQFHFADLNPIVWEQPAKFFANTTLFSWYLQHHTDELLEKIDLILPILSAETHRIFLRNLDKYSHRNLPEIVTRFCINQIEHAEKSQFKINAIDILALINQDEFLKISTEFKPSEDGKIDPSHPPENIELLRAVFRNFKKLLRPLDGLEIASKFCKGDYLKYALGSVYSTILRTPEKIAKTFLIQLHNSAVSVRKHTIHINKIICGLDEFCNFIKEQAIAEKNPSLKTILFEKSLEYAPIIPVEKCWELIKITMHAIDKDDTEAHDLLLQIGKIPEQYRALYIPEVYFQLNSNKDPSINRKKYEFIRAIPEDVIDDLNEELLHIFLSEVLFNEMTPHSDYWTNLLFHSSGEKQLSLLDYALEKFENYHKLNPNVSINDKKFKFLSPLCEDALKFRVNSAFVRKFSKIWFKSFNPEFDVSGYAYLSCLVAYAESNYNIQVLASKFNELLHDFLQTYDGYLLGTFEDALVNFFERTTIYDRILFVKKCLEEFNSAPICLMLIRLLSDCYAIPDDVRDDFFAILRKIQERPEKCVRAYFYNNFSSNKSVQIIFSNNHAV